MAWYDDYPEEDGQSTSDRGAWLPQPLKITAAQLLPKHLFRNKTRVATFKQLSLLLEPHSKSLLRGSDLVFNRKRWHRAHNTALDITLSSIGSCVEFCCAKDVDVSLPSDQMAQDCFEAVLKNYRPNCSWRDVFRNETMWARRHRTCIDLYYRSEFLVGDILHTHPFGFVFAFRQLILTEFYLRCRLAPVGSLLRQMADSWKLLKLPRIDWPGMSGDRLYDAYWGEYCGDATINIEGREVVICSPWFSGPKPGELSWFNFSTDKRLDELTKRRLKGRDYILLTTGITRTA